MKFSLAALALSLFATTGALAKSNSCQIAFYQSCERECGSGYKAVRCINPASGETFHLEACVGRAAFQKVCAPGGRVTYSSLEGEVAPLSVDGEVRAASGAVEDAPAELGATIE